MYGVFIYLFIYFRLKTYVDLDCFMLAVNLTKIPLCQEKKEWYKACY